MQDFFPTLNYDEIAEGEMRDVDVNGEMVLLAKAKGEVFAVGAICSHFHTHLSAGELDVERCLVQCPLHDSCFDLRSGEPTEPPADEPIAAYEVRIVDGKIMVCLG